MDEGTRSESKALTGRGSYVALVELVTVGKRGRRRVEGARKQFSIVEDTNVTLVVKDIWVCSDTAGEGGVGAVEGGKSLLTHSADCNTLHTIA